MRQSLSLKILSNARPLPSYRSLYDACVFQALPLRDVSRATGMSPEWICHHVRERVYPDAWTRPGALLMLLPDTDCLIVAQHGAAVQAALEELRRLMREGPPVKMEK